ncbi:MAG: hypothetical protein ACRC6A_12870 [Fusobacteriaceae bacterium]
MEIFEILGNISVVKDIFLTIKTNYNESENKRNLEKYIEKFQENITRIYEEYSKELTIVFSDSNLERIKEVLKDEDGYDLETVLKDFIRDEIIITGINLEKAKEISELFIDALLVELQHSAREVYNQVRLGQKIKNLDGKLDKLSLINYQTIGDIEADLLRVFSENDKELTLEFYNYEDKEFYNSLKNKIEIKDRNIRIDGPSREEVFYNILYFFKNENYRDTDVLIINSHKDWERIIKETSIKNKILIPYFYSEEIKPNLNNINIFIYTESQKLIDNNKITLYRRMRRNLQTKLENLGYPYHKIEEILRETNGIYSAVKRKIFDNQLRNPKWIVEISDYEKRETLKKAILLGKWESKDREEIEKIFNINYTEFIGKLRIVINTEEPLIIEHQNSYFLACPEEAWEWIKEYVTSEELIEFIKKVIEIISEIEEEYIVNYNREYSVYNSSKYKYSETLKDGLLRTLIFSSYGEGSKIIGDILENIFNDSKIPLNIKWAYISRHILRFCEISPKKILEILTKEFNSNDTSLIEIFKKKNQSFFGNSNYYINFMWAIEILLQVKETSSQALKLLFKINDLNIKYELTNSPGSTLKHVFCVWRRDVSLTKEQILLLAKYFVDNYDSAWEIIKNEIPLGRDTIIGDLQKPKYLNYLKNTNIITFEDYNYLAKGYIDICLEKCDSVQKLLSLININFIRLVYKLNIFNDLKEKIEKIILNSDDEDKKIIQDKIREMIYQNRFFSRELDDSELEEIYRDIKYSSPINKYRFLFDGNSYDYGFPLLNPIPLIEKESRDINIQKTKIIIKEKIIEFKNKGYSYIELLNIGVKNPELLGKYIFEVFSEEKLNKEDLKNLLMVSEKNKAYLGYIREAYIKFGKNGLEDILNELKLLEKNNLMIEVLLIENLNIETNEPPLIEKFSELKEDYWKKMYNRFYRNKKTYRYVIDNFLKYSNQHILQELDFGKDYFTSEELLNYLIEIKKNIKKDRLDIYYGKSILEKVYETYLGKYEHYFQIAELEICFVYFDNIKELKCFFYLLRKEPNYYSEFLKIVYKKKKDNEYIEEKIDEKIYRKIYSMYYKLDFCSCTNESYDIILDELLEWVENFKGLLEQQNQSYLFASELGKLFANSPKGKDGFYPHESIREIIENFSGIVLEQLQRSYVLKIYEKRGVYTPNEGKSEMKLSNYFKENADRVRLFSPNTAEIYDNLSKSYKVESEREKESAIYTR